jgi:hypothetical protein
VIGKGWMIEQQSVLTDIISRLGQFPLEWRSPNSDSESGKVSSIRLKWRRSIQVRSLCSQPTGVSRLLGSFQSPSQRTVLVPLRVIKNAKLKIQNADPVSFLRILKGRRTPAHVYWSKADGRALKSYSTKKIPLRLSRVHAFHLAVS